MRVRGRGTSVTRGGVFTLGVYDTLIANATICGATASAPASVPQSPQPKGSRIARGQRGLEHRPDLRVSGVVREMVSWHGSPGSSAVHVQHGPPRMSSSSRSPLWYSVQTQRPMGDSSVVRTLAQVGSSLVVEHQDHDVRPLHADRQAGR